MADFTDALEKVVLGTPRKIMMTEGGAASGPRTTRAGTRCSACSPRAPTRCGRSRSSRAGTRSASPSRARTPTSTRTRSRTCAAGSSARSAAEAAEEVVYGDVSTGAESDLDQVSRIARQMVGRWGMSERIGPDRGAAGRGPGAAVPVRRLRPVAGDPGAGGHARPAGSWTSATSGRCGCSGTTGTGWTGSPQALLRARDAGRRGGVRGGRRAPDRPARTCPGAVGEPVGPVLGTGPERAVSSSQGAHSACRAGSGHDHRTDPHPPAPLGPSRSRPPPSSASSPPGCSPPRPTRRCRRRPPPSCSSTCRARRSTGCPARWCRTPTWACRRCRPAARAPTAPRRSRC